MGKGLYAKDGTGLAHVAGELTADDAAVELVTTGDDDSCYPMSAALAGLSPYAHQAMRGSCVSSPIEPLWSRLGRCLVWLTQVILAHGQLATISVMN